ncbi:MAG TPA: hypothetical protein VM938_10705 [Acidimicrobiales bacterium]|nr:hypothetical protein [Acidimicrobiales bacterium]
MPSVSWTCLGTRSCEADTCIGCGAPTLWQASDGGEQLGVCDDCGPTDEAALQVIDNYRNGA